ncbi:hypothetical protein HN51_011846 [Arachis hypogaea]|uniref:uncharacterized protein n=1 Tax=Arachis hypogaea TaxID=3818 RepID=UPI003B20E6F3|nr:uncharacterized protein DS421_3g80420 [Arachis hypogaea]
MSRILNWDELSQASTWQFKKCCNKEQVAFMITVSVYSIVILVLWRTFLLKPFKLITVFLHELSHALACVLTCGSVEGMEVHSNEGGATKTRGGLYLCILPAGYLGSSFWGMLFILASTNLVSTRVAAAFFIAALFLVLFIARNWSLGGICVGFIIFMGGTWYLQETTPVKILQFIILFIGVMNSLFSIYDIYDDLISRRVNTSDAEKFAEVCPCCCNGVGWGIVWGFISIVFLCGAMYVATVILSQ